MNPFLDNKTLNYEVFSTFDNYPKCSVVQELPYNERCTYVKNTKECIDKKYYVNYIYLLYCGIDPQDSVQQTFGSIAMLLLILIMFIVLTITTEKLFCPSLKVMSKLLGLSEHLAGITLVAFGNGSPDLFTSLAALNSPQPLVFSQLFGAGIFVSSVVGGTICIFCPFKMLPNSIMRDGCFYILSAVYIEFIVTTGQAVTVLESVGVLSIYFFYMFTNFTDQFLLTRHIKKMEELIANDRSYATEDNIIELAELKEEVGNDNPEANAIPTQGPLDDSKPANADLFKQFLWAMNPWEHNEWVENKGNYILRAYTIFKVPVNFLLQIWIPITDFELENFGWSKLMNMFHLIVMPPGMAYLFLYPQKLFHLHYFYWALILFAPLSIVVFFTSRTDRPPRYHKLFAILSVSGSIAIIYITAAEAVEMLYVLGIIIHCSVAFLGATLVAWGNSIGDMVADVTLSRAGYQKMGFAACYGGPLFNTLLGFGIQTMYHTLNGSTGSVQLKEGHLGEDCYVFLCVILFSTLIWATSTNFYARRSVGFFSITIYFIYITFICLGETSVIQTYAPNVPDGLPVGFDWERSISEPDLTDSHRPCSRFLIKHPHEYISVDDLKYFRRKKPPDLHTLSNICLYDRNSPVLPFGVLKSEYKKHFSQFNLSLRPTLLRRATSLRLEGLMYHQSEHQDKYHWYTPQDWKICRACPIKIPESLCFTGDVSMDPEYRSSYISYPFVDRATKILPREMFRIDSEPTKPISQIITSEESATINKLAEDKLKREVAAQEQLKCHLQQRAAETKYNTTPSEYKRQFVQFPIEKAHSIPQISHIKLQGEFMGVPEYQDSFKMYANYSKSAPIKKADNLRISGAEVEDTATQDTETKPEYRDKYCDPPKKISIEKSLKTDDHLHPRGEFSKEVPEYYESFRDPQIKEVPERGKCREPYLRLKGKLEFNPEYRNTYLDFPRSRPVVRKPTSCFRLPTTTTSTNRTSLVNINKSPKHSPRRKYKSSSPNRYGQEEKPITSTDITATPEYRRAQYIYQLRERTPERKAVESNVTESFKHSSAIQKPRKSSDSSTEQPSKQLSIHKRRPRQDGRQTSILNPQSVQESYENLAGTTTKKQAKFGRRATILQNAANCRGNSSIIEGNPKYAIEKKKFNENENRDSFVVLDEPCKRSNWMKKSWYES